MKKILLTLILLVMIVLGYSLDYKIIKSETGSEISFSQLVQELATKDVVFFGELHDDSLLHHIEKELLKELTRVDHNFVLGMESFSRKDQSALNKFLSDEYSYEQLDAHSNLWSNYQEAYAGLIEIAKRDSIKVLATNVPIDISGLVARKGYSALDKLTDNERDFYAREFKPFDNRYKQMFFEQMRDITRGGSEQVDPLILERLYLAHSLKDDTMAETIFEYLEDHHKAKIFHINGNFHSVNHYGIFQKLELLNPNLKLASISPVYHPTNQPLVWDYRNYGLSEYVIMYHRDEPSLPINDKADSSEFLAIDKHNISFIFEPSARILTVSDKVTFNQKFKNNKILVSKDIKELKIYNGKEEVKFTKLDFKEKFNQLTLNTSATELNFVYIYDYPKNAERPYHFNLQEYMWHPVVSLGEKSHYEVNALGPNKMKFIAPAEVTITPQKKDAIYYAWKSFDKEYGFSVIGDIYFTKSIEVNDIFITYYSFDSEYDLLDDYLYFTEQYFNVYKHYFGDLGFENFSVIQSADNNYKSFDNMLLVSMDVFKTQDIFITPAVLGHDLAKIWINSQCLWNEDGANWQEILANFVANYIWLEANKPKEAYLWRKDALEDISAIPRTNINSLHQFTLPIDKYSAVNGFKVGGMILYYTYNKVGEANFFRAIRNILKNNQTLSGFDFLKQLQEITGVSELADFIEQKYPVRVYLHDVEKKAAKTQVKIFSSKGADSNFDLDIKLSNKDNFIQTSYHIDKEETTLEFNFDATIVEIDPEYKLYRYLDNREHIYNLKRTFLENPLFVVDQASEQFPDIYNIGNILHSNGVSIDRMPLSSFDATKWKEKSIIYIGEYNNNPVFDLFQPYLPTSFIFGKNQFTYEGLVYDQSKYSILINTQNPFNSEKSVSMWLWNSDKELNNIQEIFNYTSPSWVIFEFDGKTYNEVDKGNLIDEVLFPTKVFLQGSD